MISTKEVHRSIQSWADHYSQNDEAIAHHHQNVDEQEQDKKYFLTLDALSGPQEDKLSYIAPWFHLVCMRAEFTYYKKFTYKTRRKFLNTLCFIFYLCIQLK